MHCDALQVEGEERKGEENAMVVAATQNTRLLKVQKPRPLLFTS